MENRRSTRAQKKAGDDLMLVVFTVEKKKTRLNLFVPRAEVIDNSDSSRIRQK